MAVRDVRGKSVILIAGCESVVGVMMGMNAGVFAI